MFVIPRKNIYTNLYNGIETDHLELWFLVDEVDQIRRQNVHLEVKRKPPRWSVGIYPTILVIYLLTSRILEVHPHKIQGFLAGCSYRRVRRCLRAYHCLAPPILNQSEVSNGGKASCCYKIFTYANMHAYIYIYAVIHIHP